MEWSCREFLSLLLSSFFYIEKVRNYNTVSEWERDVCSDGCNDDYDEDDDDEEWECIQFQYEG